MDDRKLQEALLMLIEGVKTGEVKGDLPRLILPGSVAKLVPSPLSFYFEVSSYFDASFGKSGKNNKLRCGVFADRSKLYQT
jgi:hypothetical protein